MEYSLVVLSAHTLGNRFPIAVAHCTDFRINSSTSLSGTGVPYPLVVFRAQLLGVDEAIALLHSASLSGLLRKLQGSCTSETGVVRGAQVFSKARVLAVLCGTSICYGIEKVVHFASVLYKYIWMTRGYHALRGLSTLTRSLEHTKFSETLTTSDLQRCRA